VYATSTGAVDISEKPSEIRIGDVSKTFIERVSPAIPETFMVLSIEVAF
jgi:hypothetical protein